MTKYDFILKNCKVVDTISKNIFESDIYIANGRIAALGKGLAGPGEAKEIIDIGGKYVTPGLVEPHIHYESSKLPLSSFVRLVMVHGTTTVVNDPHEIANVLGVKGVEKTLEESELQPINVYSTIPSCVPATPFETSGAELNAMDVAYLISHERAIGLGEVMNFPAVLNNDSEIMAKIYAAKRLGKTVEGHAPMLSGEALKRYIAAGISSDHETSRGEELEEKINLGMHVMIRFGSQADDLVTLIRYILDNKLPTDSCMFCTDDRHTNDLYEKGHIDYTLKTAVGLGLDPLTAIQMATINPCRHFGISDKGAIKEGYSADIVAFDDILSFNPTMVMCNGKIVAKDRKPVAEKVAFDYSFGLDTIRCPQFSEEKFYIKQPQGQTGMAKARVIKVHDGSIITDSVSAYLSIKGGYIPADVKNDILKIAVIDRHSGMGGYSMGFVQGFGIREGAIASTIAHDNHNIIVVGADDKDMAYAVNLLRESGGGETVIKNGIIKASLQLEFCGLMSTQDTENICTKIRDLETEYKSLGGQLKSPFMAMSFLALPVIPNLKITDKGLYEIGQNGINETQVFL
jgi:adenine deaminase